MFSMKEARQPVQLRPTLSGQTCLLDFSLPTPTKRLSFSQSDSFNEGPVSRAAGSRSTKPGVCVHHQSTLVSTASCVHSFTFNPSLSLTHKRPHLQERNSTTHPPKKKTLLQHSTYRANRTT